MIAQPSQYQPGMAPQGDFSQFSTLVEKAQARSNQLIGSAAQQLTFNADEGRARQARAKAARNGYTDQMRDWGPQEASTPNDNWARIGFQSNVPRSLFDTESTGNFQASNDVAGSGGKGHFGVLQFSRDRLQEAINARVIPQMTPEEFRTNNQAQIAASNWHFDDIDRYIQDRGLNSYVGREVNGQKLTMNSLRAVAHLGGQTGMMRYLESNGQYNPSDAYGTALSDYAARHAGLMQTPSPRARPTR